MAVPAIDPDFADVVFMTEWHGLKSHHSGFGNIRRPHHFDDRDRHSADNEHGPEYGHTGEEIHSPAEDLAHYAMTQRLTPRRVFTGDSDKPSPGTATSSAAAQSAVPKL
jgi:hypothetical protein